MHTYFLHAYPTLTPMFDVVFPVVLFCIYLRGTASQKQERERMLAAAVSDALAMAHVSIKEAAHDMGISDSRLSRQLRCEPGEVISLTRMMHLPFLFWTFFLPALALVVYRIRMADLREMCADLKRSA